MNLKGIVSVTGKSGLYKVIGQNKSGFVFESLDELKTKVIISMTNAKVAALEDITVFCEAEDMKLEDILIRIEERGGITLDPKKATGEELRNFFIEVAPEHDTERVYSSDIKKIMLWYGVLKVQGYFDTNAADLENQPTE